MSDQHPYWLEDALSRARERFPDSSEKDLHEPMEQAAELARSSARGEREFHAVFEAELRRAIEEKAILGSPESVLPGLVPGEAPAAFQLEPETPPEPEPPAEPEEAEAQEYVLTVGSLRFHDGLSPAEIQQRLRIDEDYYAQSMRWLLRRVDEKLEGDYPSHAERDRMADFAAGIASMEDAFAVDRHSRECSGCANYLADLLDATLREAGHTEPASAPKTFRYKIRASELRRYSRSAPTARRESSRSAAGPDRTLRGAAAAAAARATRKRRKRRVVGVRRGIALAALATASSGLVAAVVVSVDSEPSDARRPNDARASQAQEQTHAVRDDSRLGLLPPGTADKSKPRRRRPKPRKVTRGRVIRRTRVRKRIPTARSAPAPAPRSAPVGPAPPPSSSAIVERQARIE